MLITNGTDEGQITNIDIKCTDIMSYCCNPIPITTTDCPRIRKEWNTMSQSERDLYINGMLQLAESGRLARFTAEHGQIDANRQAHGTSSFLPWHRYGLIWFKYCIPFNYKDYLLYIYI